jgi:hypothetical protein
MYKHREKISFGIQIISFFGSVLFLFYAWFCTKPKNIDCECYTKMLYYKQQSDSLKEVITTHHKSYYDTIPSR